MTETPPGPMTARLEEEITAEVRRQGVVVWLDRRAAYTDYVDGLADRQGRGDFPFPVVPFRGAYLEMMLALEPHGAGPDPEPLLIHMPGHTEETIRETPILEFYRAGTRFRKSLDTLVREAAAGQVAPNEIDAFLKTGPATLSDAENWLQEQTAGKREGFAAYLEGLSLEWILDAFYTENRETRKKFTAPQNLPILADHLLRHTGLDPAFTTFFNGGPAAAFPALRETFAAWLMCVEYVHNLTVPPKLDALKPLRSLSAPLRAACFRLVDHFRTRHPDAYADAAMAVESHLADEIESHEPEHLGHIDTFNREQERILAGAADSLLAGDWEKTLTPSRHRTAAASFWLRRDPVRRMTWSLIHDAARLGHLIETAGRPLADKLADAHGFDAVLNWYAEHGWGIDNAHRRFEQRQVTLLDSKMPHFTRLHEAFGRLRTRYREWADALSADFTALCERDGFLPDPALQQRTLYEQVVHPLTQDGRRVALFLLDAFRFEMAAELKDHLDAGGARATIKPRLCELPSITAVGMNALAPVSRNGKLTLAGDKGFAGFKTGEYTVRRPEDRTRAMGDRSLDNVAAGRKATRGMTLADACNRSISSLKKSCAGAALIVVHGREIDEAGGANVGAASFETLLRGIRAAASNLRSAGIGTFVFTADHGFLLNDHTVRAIPFGSKTDPDARYVLTDEPRSEAGTTRVSLKALGYEGREGYLLFPRDTAVFATARRGDAFVHGGNSLQERTIPVLTVAHWSAALPGGGRYAVSARPLPEVLGFSRVQVSAADAPNTQLTLSGTRTVTLALRCPDREEIQAVIKEATGGRLENNAVRIQADGEPAEIIFDLTGPRDERARLEIYALDSGDIASPAVVEGYFNVSGRPTAEPGDGGPSTPDPEWRDRFGDPAVRQVFVHLHDHGAITETELNAVLGSPRKVRRFALAFEDHAANAPFSVRIETTPTGKRYVKE